MANGFANAGQSADRRRRRLSHDVVDDDVFHLATECVASDNPLQENVWQSEFDTQLLRKILSPTLWKHLTAIVVLVLLTAGAIYQISSHPTAGLNHTASRFASCFLLLAGQLALLIGWIRSESDFDYKGRYRWWTSLAIALLTTAVLRLTDSTAWATETLIATAELATGALDSARLAILLVPLAVSGALLAYRIIPDMQRCFESQLVMVLAAIGVLLSTVWQSIGIADHSGSVIASLDLSVAILFFSSLLLHARYVAYINHDPPLLIQNSFTEAVADDSQDSVTDAAASPAIAAPAQQKKTKIAAAELVTPDETTDTDVEAPASRKLRPKKRRKTRRAA